MIYQQKHNGKMWWNLCGFSTQIRTQTKFKKAPKDQNKADFRSSIQTKKQETNKSRRVLLGFVDKYGNTWLRQNLWIHKMKRLKNIIWPKWNFKQDSNT